MRRVILVLTDGLRPDAITPGTMPSLHHLGADFVRATNATTIRPSATVAALASLATGVSPRGHGLVEPGLGFLGRIAGLRPLAREVRRAGRSVAVVTGEIATAVRPVVASLAAAAGAARLIAEGRTARETALAAGERSMRYADDFLFVYLSDCDRAGHRHGWMSEPYLLAAAAVDAGIALLTSCAPDALFVIVSDHGGGGVSPHEHDEPHPTNEWIPLTLAGPGVRRRQIVADRVSLLDVPPTVLWWLGLGIPTCYEGRPLTEAFEPAVVASVA